MDTENINNTNESKKFRYYFTGKLNRKESSKIFRRLIFTTFEKTLNLHIRTANLRYSL